MIRTDEFKQVVESKGLKFVWGLQHYGGDSFVAAFEVNHKSFGPVLYLFTQDLNCPSWDCRNLVFPRVEFHIEQRECMEQKVLENFLEKILERPTP